MMRLIFLSVVLLLFTTFLADHGVEGKPLCVKYPCCNITSSSSCPFSQVAANGQIFTLVLPGGKTSCIFQSSTPFAFQLFPGDRDKLLVYFQGGGACWDKSSTDADFCTPDSIPQGQSGIFQRSSTLNPYANYTIVQILYCSGDLHAGNVTRSYKTLEGGTVVQVGMENTLATLDWIKRQQQNGELASRFSDLIVMGCSAGSIGAQIWARVVLEMFQWDHASVIPDSYVGVFPNGTQGPLIISYGMCNTLPLEFAPDLNKKCNEGTLTLQDFTDRVMGLDPRVPFAFIQSKTDIVQRTFYSALATSVGMDPVLSAAQFYQDVTNIFTVYNKHSNFVTYLIDGEQHCYTPLGLFYSADPEAANPAAPDDSDPLLYQWISNLPLQVPGQTIDTICVTGENRNTGCSSNIVPKTYQEPKF